MNIFVQIQDSFIFIVECVETMVVDPPVYTQQNPFFNVITHVLLALGYCHSGYDDAEI